MLVTNFEYNPNYFNGNHLISKRGNLTSFNHFVMNDGVILGMFQGSRGSRPDLDFILKFLTPGLHSRLRTPAHTHWIVDLLLKYQSEPAIVRNFVIYYRQQYNLIQPFETIEERNNYIPYSPQYILTNFQALNHAGTLSIEFLANLIELFIKCEKRTVNAFMFRGLLQMMVDYCEGRKDYFQVISHSRHV